MLASQGVLFKKHYAQATPCSPSRTSLHTGMYMHNHRVCVNGTPFDPRHTNWAEVLQKNGYEPFLFGYTDTAKDPRGLDFSDSRLKHYSEPLPGIETETVYLKNMPQNWVNYIEKSGYDIPEPQWDIYQTTEPGVQWEDGGDKPLPLKLKTEHHEPHFMINECKEWITKQTESWATHLSIFRPHPPFVAPEPYNGLYDPEELDPIHRKSNAEVEGQLHPWLEHQLSQPEFRAPENPQTLKRLKSSYYGLMKEVDDNLGELFQTLKEIDQWEDTLIIFTSDHGEQMGDHWLMGKSGFYDASYHIPLIIRDPRSSADQIRGQKISHFTENVDIVPTILDAINIDIPSQCDGRSLMHFVNSRHAPTNWRTEVHWEYDFRDILSTAVENKLNLTQHQCSMNIIRDDHYKYVHFTALPPLFFDLQADPDEMINLADHADYQSIVLKYAQKLISWRMNHDDRGLTETYLSVNGPVTRHSQAYI